MTSDTQARLERLRGYLAEDPGNAQLRFDVAQAAIAAGQLQAAEVLLDDLARGGAAPAAVDHDRALVRLLRADVEGCLHRLRPRVLAGEADPSLQVLWLRAQHQAGALEAAWSWTCEQQRAGQLARVAAGVAALIAVDLDRLPEAEPLAQRALQEEGCPVEALVAQASLHLARREPASAQALLQQALRRDGRQGRAWSALAFCSLLSRDFAAARGQFERATAAMTGHVGTWLGRGWCELLLQELPAALHSFRQALELDDTFAESQAAVGLLLALNGDRERAAAHLARAERLDAANLTGRYARALLAGEASTQAQLLRLANALLDRPGPLGGPMRAWVQAEA